MPASFAAHKHMIGRYNFAHLAAAVFICLALVPGRAIFADEKPGMLLPSEGLQIMLGIVMRDPETRRMDVQATANRYLPRIIKTDLDRREQFFLGDVYMFALMPEEARDVFLPYLKGDDLYARAAWQRIVQIRFRAFRMYDQAAKDVVTFRERFLPIPEDTEYMSGQVVNLGMLYAEQGEHDSVVALIEAELEALTQGGDRQLDAAYRSLEHPATFAASYKAMGKLAQAQRHLRTAIEQLRITLDQRRASPPESDYNYPLPAARYQHFFPAAVHAIGWQQQNRDIERMIAKLEQQLAELT